MKVLFPTNATFNFDKRDPGVTYVPYDPTERVPAEHHDADVLVVWLNPPARLREAAADLRNIKLIQGLMAGVNTIVDAGFSEDVPISNGRGLHDLPVAEHTVALLLAATRRLHLMRDAQLKRRWPQELGGAQPDRDPEVLTTLQESNVTVWGFGSIAKTLAPMLVALGANVTGVATTAGERAGFRVVAESDLDSLLPKTDALIMILPASEETAGALDSRRLALLPQHAWVVNVGRGSSIDEGALHRALTNHEIGGAALDVFATEPLPADSPLWGLANVLISPHAAGGRPLGADAYVRENVRRLAAGESLLNVVDRSKGY